MSATLTKEAKKAIYQSAHRGCKELDLLLGRFAEEIIPSFSQAELASFVKLLEMEDDIIYSILLERTSPPKDLAPVIQKIIAYNTEVIYR